MADKPEHVSEVLQRVLAGIAERQPPLAVRSIETQSTCDVCGRHRAHGKHDACSKERQKKHAGKWEAHKLAVQESKNRRR